MATHSTIVRRPRFSIRFITEKSEFLIEHDVGAGADNNFMSESVISITTTNSMAEDTSAFAITLAGDVLWDKILNENDLVILRIEPNEQNPQDLFTKDTVKNPTVVVGLVSEVRVEADYAEDSKMYRITGQSLQKAFIQFSLQTIRQAGMVAPTTVGWMDYNSTQSYDGNVEVEQETSNQTPIQPLDSVVVNSEYGMRDDPFEDGLDNHTGIDFAGSVGDPVYAVLDGTVYFAGSNPISGNYVTLQHGDYYTHYAHLSQLSVSTGQTVNQGDKIGEVGSTGSSTGPHLHFEVTQGGPSFGDGAASTSINPRTFLGDTIPIDGQGQTFGINGGFAQVLMGKTAEEVVMTLVNRFTQYMEYDFDGEEDAGIPYDDIFDNRVLFYYDTWEEDEQLMNPLPITSYEGSFNNLLQTAAPRPFLEYFWDTDTEDSEYGKEKGIMYVRRTPFDKGDWEKLPTHQITSHIVLSESVAKNDLEAYSVYNCVPNLTSEQLALSSAVPYYHPSLVVKYGYNLLEVENPYISIEGAMDTEGETEEDGAYPLGNPNSMPAKYAQKLFTWYYHNPNFFSGEITIVGHPDIRIGNKLVYKNERESEVWEYYIESVEHNFSYADGFTTTIGVTRGLRLEGKHPDGGRFTGVPEPEYFRGGYLGEMSYKDLEAVAQAENASLSSGGMSNSTTGSIGSGGSAAARRAAQEAVRVAEMEARDGNTTGYDWGGGRGSTNPFKGDPPYYADCSSFVYWMYDYAGVRLGDSTGVTTYTLLKEPQLETIGDIGSNITQSDLEVGDLVFFRGDSGHVGIYVGNGEWVGMNGSGYKNLARGVEQKPLFSGYWANEFLGQVRRLKA